MIDTRKDMPRPMLKIEPSRRRWPANAEALRGQAPRRGRETISDGDEVLSIMACNTGTEFIPCEDDDGTGGTIPGGLTIPASSTCFVTSGASGDTDADGITQECEYQLANAFRPHLAVTASEPFLGREPYFAVKKGDAGSSVHIFYAFAYYRDGGDPTLFDFKAHPGDSEFVVARVFRSGINWYLESTYTSAHWRAGFTDSSENTSHTDLYFPTGARTRPLIWVARNKHGNFSSLGECNSGAVWNDDCSTNSFHAGLPTYELEVLSNANLGNSGAPLINGYVGSRNGMPGTECLWCSGILFQGWTGLSSPDAGYTYQIPLEAFGF